MRVKVQSLSEKCQRKGVYISHYDLIPVYKVAGVLHLGMYEGIPRAIADSKPLCAKSSSIFVDLHLGLLLGIICSVTMQIINPTPTTL